MLRRLAILTAVFLIARPAGAWQDEPTPIEEVSPLVDLRSEVESATKVLKRVPEGSVVRKGETVLTLDDSVLAERLVNQEINVARAEAAAQNIQKTREIAEIAVNEYAKGAFPLEVQAIEGEKVLAQAELERAKDRLRWSEELLQNEKVTEGQVIADRLTVLKAEIAISQAERKLSVLQNYTYPKTIRELKDAIARCVAEESSLEQTLALERSKSSKLRLQVEACVIRSPIDGIVVYPTGEGRLEVGDRARERQLLARVVPIPTGR